MRAQVTQSHSIDKNPWPTREDALEAARFIAGEARKVYGDRLESVWLYGSRARSDHRPDSDLDVLLVKIGREADPQDRLRRELRDLLVTHHLEGRMWGFLSLQSAYSEQLAEWDTMFYRNVRADALQVL